MALLLLPSLQECAAACGRLAPVLLSAAAGSVIVLGVACLASALLRRASAAARHGVWLMASVGLLLLPMLSAALPGWYVLPRAGRDAPRSTETVITLPAPPPLQTDAPPAAPPPINPNPVGETTVNTQIESPTASTPKSVEATAPTVAMASLAPTSPAPQPAPARQTARPAWTVLLLPFWAVGALLVLGRVALGHLSLWALRRRCTRVADGPLFDQLQRLRRELGIRRPVELLGSRSHAMPMTWGVLSRAKLLVPEQIADWPAGQRRDVLLHELGHVKRADCLTQFLSQVACAMYWFNPLAWVASRRMRVERERACDDLVLNRGADAPAYARHLLASVSSAATPTLRLVGAAAAAVPMARPSTLEERVRAILDARLNRRAPTARARLAVALLLGAALVPAAALRAQPEPPAQEPSTSDTAPERPARAARAGRGGPASRAAPTTRPAGRPTFPGGRSNGFEGGFGGGGMTRLGGGGFGGGGGAAAAATLGEGPTCSLDATVYDLRIPVEQIGTLDVDALLKAAETAGGFEKALAGLGTARPMYRASQSVRLSGDLITIGSETPVVTSARTTDRGQTVNTIQYVSTGALFRLAGRAGAAGGGIDLELGIEVSATSPTGGGAAITENVEAPVMRRATMSYKGPVQPRKPFVVLSVDAGSVDKDGKAVAYVGRVTVGEPQPPAPR